MDASGVGVVYYYYTHTHTHVQVNTSERGLKKKTDRKLTRLTAGDSHTMYVFSFTYVYISLLLLLPPEQCV